MAESSSPTSEKTNKSENISSEENSSNKVETPSSKVTNESKGFFSKIWFWLTDSKQRLFSLLFLVVFIGLMLILGFLKQDPTVLMMRIVFGIQEELGSFGLYLGVGIISIFGNFVMFIPILYAVVLMFVAVLFESVYDVFLLGIAAGIGASIGQIASWFVGRATKNLVDDRLDKQIKRGKRWVDRGLAPLMIFIFAATPLPDEVLLIVIGLIGYSLGKTLFYCFIGKIVLTMGVSFVANFISRTNFGEWFLLTFFNVTRENLLTQTIPESEVWTSITLWIITASLVVLVTFIDWMKLYDKIKCQREFKQIQTIIQQAEMINFPRTADELLTNSGDSLIKIRSAETSSQDYFPKDSLWFLEEKIEGAKRNISLRKSLLSVSAICGKPIEVFLGKEWFTRFQQNITATQFKQVTRKELSVIKMPRGVIAQGFLSDKAQLIAFKAKMPILFKNVMLPENGPQKRLKVEFLLEQYSSGLSRVWAFGLKEGIYLQMIETLEPDRLLYLWLTALIYLSNYPKEVKKLTISNLSLEINEAIDLDIPDALITECSTIKG